jgi:hypothetical protein
MKIVVTKARDFLAFLRFGYCPYEGLRELINAPFPSPLPSREREFRVDKTNS